MSKFNEIFLSPILAAGGGAPWCWAEISGGENMVRASEENIPRSNGRIIFVTLSFKLLLIKVYP